MALRDMPTRSRNTPRRGLPPPPPPPLKPSRTVRPRAKFTPKSHNLQAFWHNEWHDISIVNGPYKSMTDDTTCYDIVIYNTEGSQTSEMNTWPERLIRRNNMNSAAAMEPEQQPKRFPLGCIVWARVKGAHDWSPGWDIEMSKNEAPAHMRHNTDAYCVQVILVVHLLCLLSKTPFLPFLL